MYILVLIASTGLMGLTLALITLHGARRGRSPETEQRRLDGVHNVTLVASGGPNAVARIPRNRVSSS
ncbi:MAG: hypothetical protein WCJ30_22740 [Deltaproteobacteria bacterium]